MSEPHGREPEQPPNEGESFEAGMMQGGIHPEVGHFTIERRGSQRCAARRSFRVGIHSVDAILGVVMIRKLKSGEYRLYSRKKDPRTGRRRNLGTFKTRAEARKHERAVQFFKHER